MQQLAAEMYYTFIVDNAIVDNFHWWIFFQLYPQHSQHHKIQLVYNLDISYEASQD